MIISIDTGKPKKHFRIVEILKSGGKTFQIQIMML